MKPVLLDQKSIFRAGITISLTMLVVFFSGYYIGQQKADSGKGMGLNKTMALALPRPAHADTAEYEPLIPQAQIPGANIDVDSPDNKAAGVINKQQADMQLHTAAAEVETVIKETTDIIEISAGSDSSNGQDNQQLQLASLEITAGVVNPGNETDAINEIDDKQLSAADEHQLNDSIEPGMQAEIIDTANAEDARYTIQVGVFADAENALRKKSELESQKLTAYINEYTNKRDALRFNVRFGYFKDKSSALAALTSFEHSLSGSGYVTRIRRN
jgi:cell division septation protein DedD